MRCGMLAIKERLRPHLEENPAAFKLEKWLQYHVGGNPAIYFNLVRLFRTRQDLENSRSNPRDAIGHRRVPEVGQYVCQEGIRFCAEREHRPKAHS